MRFAKDYLSIEEGARRWCKLSLCVEGKRGRERKVICRIQSANAKVSSGWKEFVKENCLKVGDVCVFELEAKNAFKVIIYRA